MAGRKILSACEIGKMLPQRTDIGAAALLRVPQLLRPSFLHNSPLNTRRHAHAHAHAHAQVLLVKPVTFMNNSGEAVAALAKFYQVPAGRVLVVADDLDQPTAQVRVFAFVSSC